MGWLYQEPLDNIEKAQANYDRVLELDPEYAVAYNNRGNTYGDIGEYEQALADYDRALELGTPDDARVYNNRGNTYQKMGEYERALADYNGALALDPYDCVELGFYYCTPLLLSIKLDCVPPPVASGGTYG